MLAACAPSAAPLSTATAIVVTEAPSASPRPPSPTTAPTATDAPTATALPSATPTASATEPTATATEVPATATDAPTATSSPRPTASDFTPTAVSIWDTAFSGGDTMTGTCANAVTPVYGLVQITPQGDTLGWKNQEPAPYTFSRVSANVWQYSGPTSTGDGNVTMTVTFTSATTLRLSRVFTPTDDQGCTHTHQYTGNFRNFR